MADQTRAQLRELSRRLMRDLERDGYGTFSNTAHRDIFRLSYDLPGLELVTTRPTARNHIRSEDNSLLFRDPAVPFLEMIEGVVAPRTEQGGHKGVDLLYSGLTPDVIRDLFATVRELARKAPH